MQTDYQSIYQQVWLEAWCNTARADNCTTVEAATKWADKCLAEFKTRFPSPVPFNTVKTS